MLERDQPLRAELADRLEPDPDLDLGREYRSVARALAFSDAEMAAIALDGIDGTWLDDGEKRRLRASFQREIDGLLAAPMP